MKKNRISIGRAFLRATLFTGMSILTAMAQTPGNAGQPNASTPSRETRAVRAPSKQEVRAAQLKLRNDGLYHGRIDGILGPQTREGLVRYQQQHHLQADGRLTRRTGESLGIAKPGGYFETAGNEYAGVGKDFSGGATGMANRFEQGNVGGGFEHFGKGVWHGMKGVGSATESGAKGVYHGAKKAF
jgi:peptidoglycan hydrolase-like protein with peptidoglycan-binding domain